MTLYLGLRARAGTTALNVDALIAASVAVSPVPSVPTVDGVSALAATDNVVSCARDDYVAPSGPVDYVPAVGADKGLGVAGSFDRDRAASALTAVMGEGRANGRGDYQSE